jgi:hypothetical protein
VRFARLGLKMGGKEFATEKEKERDDEEKEKTVEQKIRRMRKEKGKDRNRRTAKETSAPKRRKTEEGKYKEERITEETEARKTDSQKRKVDNEEEKRNREISFEGTLAQLFEGSNAQQEKQVSKKRKKQEDIRLMLGRKKIDDEEESCEPSPSPQQGPPVPKCGTPNGVGKGGEKEKFGKMSKRKKRVLPDWILGLKPETDSKLYLTIIDCYSEPSLRAPVRTGSTSPPLGS